MLSNVNLKEMQLAATLRTQDLHFGYNSQLEFRFPDISVSAGESLLILGKSGVGKTTLLHLLGGLLRAWSGDVWVDGTSLQSLSGSQQDKLRGRHIGFVFQRSQFISSLSVLENLLLSQHLAGQKPSRPAAIKLLQDLDMAKQINQKPLKLSEGQKQRMSIAAAVLKTPRLILADEPSSSLDDASCARVSELLKEQAAKAKAALVIITHDQRLKAQFSNQLSL